MTLELLPRVYQASGNLRGDSLREKPVGLGKESEVCTESATFFFFFYRDLAVFSWIISSIFATMKKARIVQESMFGAVSRVRQGGRI